MYTIAGQPEFDLPSSIIVAFCYSALLLKVHSHRVYYAALYAVDLTIWAIKRFFSIEIYVIDRHSIKPNNSENSKARQFQKLFGFVQDKSLDPMKVIFKVRGSGYGAVGKAINTSSNPVPSPSSFLLNAVSF